MDTGRSALRVFAARIGSSTISFVGLAIFANLLGAAELGLFFIFQSLLGMMSIPADLGLRQALEKRLSESQDPTHLSTGLVLKAIPLSIVSVIAFAFRSQINSYAGGEIAWLLIIGLVVQELSSTFLKVINSELRVAKTAPVRFLQTAIWFGLGICLILFAGYRTGVVLIISLIVGLFVVFIVAYRMSRTEMTMNINMKDAKSLVSFGKYSFLGSLGGFVYNWMDVLLIGYFLSNSSVGMYETAWRVTVLVLLLPRAMWMAIYPQFSSWYNEDSVGKIERMVGKMVIPAIILPVPAIIGVAFLSTDILSLIFGEEFVVASTVLILLMIEKLPRAVFLLYQATLDAVDLPNLNAKSTIVSIILNLILNLLLIPVFGLIGAAVATLVSSVVRTVICGYYSHLNYVIKYDWIPIIWCLISGGVMGGLLWISTASVNVDSIGILLSIIIFHGIVYMGILLLSTRTRNTLLDVYHGEVSA